MGDARLIHKRGSHGDRIVALSHLDHRVWVQYVLSADDYGVMRASASVLRADNPRLEQEPMRVIEASMRRIVESTLVATFTHQAVLFWWQMDWQDFQQIRYPRDTVMPAPSPDLLAQATPATQDLFALRAKPSRHRSRKVSGTVPETFPEYSGNIPEMSPLPARAGGRETLTPTLTPTLPGSGSSEKSARETIEPLADPTVALVYAHPRPRQNHSLVGNHAGCYFAPDACAAGMCVPAWLGAQWTRQYRGDDARAEREIRLFVASSLVDLAPGQDPKKFWQAAWTRHHGATVPAAPMDGKGNASAAAMARVIAKREQRRQEGA